MAKDPRAPRTLSLPATSWFPCFSTSATCAPYPVDQAGREGTTHPVAPQPRPGPSSSASELASAGRVVAAGPAGAEGS